MKHKVPFVKFKVREAGVWVEKTTDDFFGGKRVVVFGLPGAFTPTCSSKQLPGYETKYKEFKERGIDEIYCVSVNDSFVMNAWLKDQRVKNVEFIPDGSCEFTAGMDMLVKKDNLGFGARSWRYAMIVNDGVVEKMFVEPGKSDDCETDPYGETSPETVLEFLRGA